MSPELLCHLRRISQLVPLGKKRLLLPRVMRSLFHKAKGQVTVEDFDGAFRMRLDLAEHMQRRIFWVGYYSREVVGLLNTLIRPGMVVFDVGANIGEITLVAARRTTSIGKVIAFEPVNSIADRLDEHVRENALTWVSTHRLGLSDRQGEANIYASCNQWKSTEPHRGLGSLYPGDENASPLQSIPLATLDNFISNNPQERLDLIKLDIEGAELPCLRGAKSTLQHFKPMLIIEVQADTSKAAGYEQSEILGFLGELGYRFQRIGHDGALEEVDQHSLATYQNILCTHPNGVTPA